MIKIILVFALLFLSACGGSSPDTNTGTGSGTGTGADTVNLTAKIVQNTVCETQRPTSNAELVIYDNDWEIISRSQADPAGQISVSVSKETSVINFSIISENTVENVRNILVNTFAQHPVGDLGIFVIPGKVNEGCECVKTSIQLTSDLTDLFLNTHLVGHIEGTDNFYLTVPGMPGQKRADNVSICRETGKSWPLLTATSGAGSYVGAAGNLKGYQPGQLLEIRLDQNAKFVDVAIDSGSNLNWVRQSHNVVNGSSSQDVPFWESKIMVFDELDGDKVLSLFALANDEQVVRENVNIFGHNFEKFRFWFDRTQTRNYDLPLTERLEISLHDDNPQTELEQLFTEIILYNGSDYDLSNISNYVAIYTSLTTTLNDGSVFSWMYTGPKQGIFPRDPMPGDKSVFNKINTVQPMQFSVGLTGYKQSQDYEQYLKDNIARSKLPGLQRLTGKWAEQNSVYLRVVSEQ